MEPENLNQETPQVEQTSRLHKVTPFSKYLALALFVILPFVGGYIGYIFAPEKIVEVEKVVFQKADSGAEAVKTTQTETVVGEDGMDDESPTDKILAFSGQYDADQGSETLIIHVPSEWADYRTTHYSTVDELDFYYLQRHLYVAPNYAGYTEEIPLEPCDGGCDSSPIVTSGMRMEYEFVSPDAEQIAWHTMTENSVCNESAFTEICNSGKDGRGVYFFTSMGGASTVTDERTAVTVIVDDLNGFHRFRFVPADDFPFERAEELAREIVSSAEFFDIEEI